MPENKSVKTVSTVKWQLNVIINITKTQANPHSCEMSHIISSVCLFKLEIGFIFLVFVAKIKRRKLASTNVPTAIIILQGLNKDTIFVLADGPRWHHHTLPTNKVSVFIFGVPKTGGDRAVSFSKIEKTTIQERHQASWVYWKQNLNQ